ncbi:hypothetical protein NSK_000824 [Nannochloropsis salina CCMP1776]|uniref:Uncharacterized protein n=1 Tax=Nannochloropsis salina CCMP1776 TaxID=1027361 RepID=A0A4D9D6X7_9STRA|nr:hypothetical protein NSK_000824 [Nannochloropsis salina CCMP1776]|eukprot:TFJ87471.1 hypothetical protein NSK_000824 [Nannochloropsis salina CCMP1776]
MASFPFRLSSGGNNNARYAPLSTTTLSDSASHAGGAYPPPRSRPPPISASLRRCLSASFSTTSPCFFVVLFFSVVAVFLWGPWTYLPSTLHPLGQALSSLTGGCHPEDFERLGRAVWVADPAFARKLGCDPNACHCLFVESGAGTGGGGGRHLASSLPPPLPPSLTPAALCRREGGCESAMDVSRLEARRKTASGREEGKEGGREEGREEGREGGRRRTQKDEGGGGYIRQVLLGASIKQVHYFQEDKPLCLVPHRRYDELVQLPGGYGTFLMRRLGTLIWAEDFGVHGSILFDDLWVRPYGRWLYPVHSFFPEVTDLTKQVVTYGPHVDARWNQMAGFFRRQILGAGSANAHRDTQQLLQPSTQPYILLVDRAASRLLKDNSTRTFEEITRVLREEGGLTNLEAVRMEDIPEVWVERKEEEERNRGFASLDMA